MKSIHLDRTGNLINKVNIKPAYLILASFLCLVAASCEGISIWTLIPLTRGVLNMDFGFIKGSQLFKKIVTGFFPSVIFSNKVIFILLIGALFISMASKYVFEYIATVLVSKQIRMSSNSLMKQIFKRYLSFGKMFFDKKNAGCLQNVLLNFTFMVALQLSALQTVLTNFFLLFVYLIFMFKISWKLSLFAIFLFPVLHYAIKWLMKKLEKSSVSLAESFDAISGNISNILSCIPLVKLYTDEENEERRFNRMSDRIEKILFSLDKKRGLMGPLQEMIVLVAILGLIVALAVMVLKQKALELSSFLVFFYILRRAQRSFSVFNEFMASLAVIKGQIQEIVEIFDDRDKCFIPEGDKEFPGLKTDIEFNNLDFCYQKDLRVLSDITFIVKKGMTTAIVGPTGAGKTTIINLLLRFYDTSSGMITIDGNDIRGFTLKSLRTHMALVSQDVLLFNDTLRNNIIYGLKEKISGERLADVAKKARLYDFIMTLPNKFDTYIGDRGILLSGGEKQRVAIARALLKGAEILILDEATSSLDTKTEKLIQEAIDEAVKDRTAIVIAHRFSTIKNADKIVVIKEGRLVEEGRLNELLDKKGKFYEYWQEQKFY